MYLVFDYSTSKLYAVNEETLDLAIDAVTKGKAGSDGDEMDGVEIPCPETGKVAEVALSVRALDGY